MKEWLDGGDREMNILKTRQAQKEQQKMSPAIKKNKTRNDVPKSSSVVSTIDSSQQVGRTPEEKIGRIQVRVSNIL
jgi:DNA-directed RNA polymerase subunit M/transcription elongation factor TFIIS